MHEGLGDDFLEQRRRVAASSCGGTGPARRLRLRQLPLARVPGQCSAEVGLGRRVAGAVATAKYGNRFGYLFFYFLLVFIY